VLLGCANISREICKPALFPYIEYHFKAHAFSLSGVSSKEGDFTPNITLFNMNMSIPEGWTYEKMHNDAVGFKSVDGRSFLISFNSDSAGAYAVDGFKLIGCNNFTAGDTIPNKTAKDYYRDIFLLTPDQLGDDPTFWEYSILWSKTNILRNAVKLLHIEGDHLAAFQRNVDPSRMIASVQSHLAIFPCKIEPDYLAIAAGFTDDAFFVLFLKMLDVMNT
jgi:hypothetical protein